MYGTVSWIRAEPVRQRTADLAFAAALLALVLVSAEYGPARVRTPVSGWLVAVSVLVCSVVPLRRRRPGTALAIATAGTAAYLAEVGYHPALLLAPLVLLHHTAASAGRAPRCGAAFRRWPSWWPAGSWPPRRTGSAHGLWRRPRRVVPLLRPRGGAPGRRSSAHPGARRGRDGLPGRPGVADERLQARRAGRRPPADGLPGQRPAHRGENEEGGGRPRAAAPAQRPPAAATASAGCASGSASWAAPSARARAPAAGSGSVRCCRCPAERRAPGDHPHPAGRRPGAAAGRVPGADRLHSARVPSRRS